MKLQHGYPIADWEAAKDQAKVFLRIRARQQRPINYEGLCREIKPIRLVAHSTAMNAFLDEISREEEAAGRGLLSAFVNRKIEGDPGPGFYKMAHELGRSLINGELAFWVEEMRSVGEKNR